VVKFTPAQVTIYSVVAGGGAALIGGAIGVPLLLRARKTWDKTMWVAWLEGGEGAGKGQGEGGWREGRGLGRGRG
jgi:hypothetical protein